MYGPQGIRRLRGTDDTSETITDTSSENTKEEQMPQNPEESDIRVLVVYFSIQNMQKIM